MKFIGICQFERLERVVLCLEKSAIQVVSFPPQRQHKDFYNLHPLTKVNLQA
jgi:hypothetical protein